MAHLKEWLSKRILVQLWKWGRSRVTGKQGVIPR